ncbi:MAG TPA: hypothetical protein PKA88_25760 [Polyangiaceae bacterium]|nr:hypothetical protein [Polyangiaceae bacterium]
MAAPTPGPWRRFGAEIYGANGDRVAEAVRAHDVPLIESAPLLLDALSVQVANIERWLETGTPSGPEESKAIYEQMKAALEAAKAGPAT